MGGYMPGEPPEGIKAKAAQFAEACRRDGWGEGIVYVQVLNGNATALSRYEFVDGHVKEADAYARAIGCEWERKVLDD